MSQPNYSDIERGKTKPSVEQLIRFAQILDTAIDALIHDEIDQSDIKMDFIDGHQSGSKMSQNEMSVYIDILESQVRNLLDKKQ